MSTKKWYKSRTIWVNIIALVALFSGSLMGFQLSAEETGAILVAINLFFRIITGSGLEA